MVDAPPSKAELKAAKKAAAGGASEKGTANEKATVEVTSSGGTEA